MRDLKIYSEKLLNNHSRENAWLTREKLDESNNNPFIVPAETVKIIGELSSKTTTNKKAKEKIPFTNQLNAVAGKQKSSECPRNKPGATSFAKEVKTQLECFQLFYGGGSYWIHCHIY